MVIIVCNQMSVGNYGHRYYVTVRVDLVAQ